MRNEFSALCWLNTDSHVPCHLIFVTQLPQITNAYTWKTRTCIPMSIRAIVDHASQVVLFGSVWPSFEHAEELGTRSNDRI